MPTSCVVVVCLYVLQFVHVSGQTPSLTGPTSGVLGSSVHLICTISGSSVNVGGLSFSRAGVESPQCLLNIAACSRFSVKEGYSCGCVSGQTRELYLNISTLRKQDDDTWSCLYNGVKSNNISINVYFIEAPVMTIKPSEVMENASVHLECRVSSNPTVEMTISNLDNNTYIVDGEMTNTRQLDIDRVQCLHNGTFQCVINNRALSRSETVTKELNVLCLPRYDVRTSPLTTVAAALNEPVQLVAEVIANPSPNFTWGKLEGDDLVPIRNSRVSMVDSSELKSVLRIKVTSSKDYGQYAVKVQNTVGETLLKYKLTAKDPDGETLNVAAVAGGIVAAILVIIIVAGVFILYKRETCRHFCWSEGKRNGDTSSGGRNREDLVIWESAASGKVGRGSRVPPVAATGGASDAAVNKKPKPTKAVADVYAQVEPKKAPKKGDIYENTSQGQFQADADVNTFANSGYVDDDHTKDETADVQNPQPRTGRDADGCMYVGIDFSNQKPGKVIIGKEKGSYVDIAHGKVGPPPPPDDDDDEEEWKKKKK